MQTFFRSLINVVLPVVLRLIASQLEAAFEKGGEEE